MVSAARQILDGVAGALEAATVRVGVAYRYSLKANYFACFSRGWLATKPCTTHTGAVSAAKQTGSWLRGKLEAA